jgi:hypothetical protein
MDLNARLMDSEYNERLRGVLSVVPTLSGSYNGLMSITAHQLYESWEGSSTGARSVSISVVTSIWFAITNSGLHEVLKFFAYR